MNWRPILLSRYSITFGTLAVVTLIWNGYVALHDDGIIKGRVIAPDGRPVAGATVVLSERTLLVTTPRAQATTDADGRFTFSGHTYHRIWLEATKAGVGSYPQTEYRMYFKGQNKVIDSPLRLEPGAAAGSSGKPS